jgi:uncharacterized protein (TIGR03083 family)
MTNADTIIVALRAGHDSLADLVAGLSDDDLARPSGAAEWDISQVLSHLGSGAEIAQSTVRAALDGQPNPGRDFNTTVWDRWNAMSRRHRADGFLQANQALTELFESMDAATRESLRIDLGFMPAPVDVAAVARLRLNELTLHAWDVRVSFDPHATLAEAAILPLLQNTADMLGWISKPEQLNGQHADIQVTTSRPAAVFILRLNTRVSVDFDTAAQADGSLTLPAEAWLRLVAGRLSAEHTPNDVVITGAADLDVLRRVFAGY